jgi:hypothetical protein
VSDLRGRANSAQEAQGSTHAWREPESAAASLPAWLVKELQRAGVGDETIKGLDEATARDVVAEIRSDETE